MLIINENGLTKLIAEENMMLQKADCIVKQVALGCNDSADNWREITVAEYQEILAAEIETPLGEGGE